MAEFLSGLHEIRKIQIIHEGKGSQIDLTNMDVIEDEARKVGA